MQIKGLGQTVKENQVCLLKEGLVNNCVYAKKLKKYNYVIRSGVKSRVELNCYYCPVPGCLLNNIEGGKLI